MKNPEFENFLSSKNIVLTCKNLSFAYQKQNIFSGIDFSFQTGDFIALCGKNGSGKSTFLKLLSGIIQTEQEKSEIFFENQTQKIFLKDLKSFQRAKLVSFLAQSENPLWQTDVFSFILQGRFCWSSNFYKKSDFKIVKETSEILKITDLLEKNIFSLSGGELQKVKIARSLVQGAKFIFLDEPTSFLDIAFEQDFVELLKNICKEKNIGILFSIHNLNISSRFAEKIAFLTAERRLIFGKTENVLTKENLFEVYKKDFLLSRHPIYNSILVN